MSARPINYGPIRPTAGAFGVEYATNLRDWLTMESGSEIRFPVAGNPRLAQGTAEQLGRMEISPYGIHWPELDEDLSFQGLLIGDYGQHQKVESGRQED